MDKIFGIKVDKINEEKILEKVKFAIDNKQKIQIVTLNTEMIMAAQEDPRLKQLINEAEIVIPESAGVYLAENYLSAKKGNKIVRLFSSTWQTISGKTGNLPTRISGVDLSYSIAGLCEEFGYDLLLLGAKEGVAAVAATNLKKQFQKLKVKGLYGGEPNSSKLIEEIRNTNPEVIFVAYGHGKQEKWIAQNLNQISAFVAMGVGGSLDYFANSVPRAPKWLRQIGFEWLFRLMMQPSRAFRQINLIRFVQNLLKSS